jgi:hypothetical protein
MKSRRMRSAGYEACMGSIRTAYNMFVRKLEGKTSLEYLGVDESIILKWILQ